MRYTARAVVTEYYDIDIELEDNLVEGFCHWEGITKEEFLADLDRYRHSFGYYLNSEWGFYEVGRYQDSDSDLYDAEFVLETNPEIA
jgi:hypothetical protein